MSEKFNGLSNGERAEVPTDFANLKVLYASLLQDGIVTTDEIEIRLNMMRTDFQLYGDLNDEVLCSMGSDGLRLKPTDVERVYKIRAYNGLRRGDGKGPIINLVEQKYIDKTVAAIFS
jgi:hypothetical protein